MSLAVLTDIPDDSDLRQPWNDLVLRMDQPQVFYTYEWSLAVSRAYQNSLHPLCFLAYDQNRLCGVAALATDPAGRQASFLCASTGDYCDFVGADQQRGIFVEAVLAELKRRGIREITLANIPADSATIGALKKSGVSRGYRTFARTGYICTQVKLASLERAGDGKLVLPRRKMVRRFLSVMSREKPVRVDHANAPSALEAALPQFFQAHIARFLYTGRVSNIARKERRAFLKELAVLLSEPGWIDLTMMASGDKTFAWNYGFRYRGIWFWYQPTFDNNLEKYSPGFCLLTKLIEEAADDPTAQLIDLGLGAEEYKDRFANETREILYVTLKTSLIRHYREIVRYRTARLVSGMPKLEGAARKLLEKSNRLKQQLRTRGRLATISALLTRIRKAVWSKDEVLFFEWGSPPVTSDWLDLRPLDWNGLAQALIQHVDDQPTVDYLLRAASRLRGGKARAYGLIGPSGDFLHFAWTVNFQRFFLAELNDVVDGPSQNCEMIFDCWTPTAVRRSGNYLRAIRAIAQLIQEEGKRPWIFGAASNVASVHGVQAAGFHRRYAIARMRLLGFQWIPGRTSNARKAHDEAIHVPSKDSAA